MATFGTKNVPVQEIIHCTIYPFFAHITVWIFGNFIDKLLLFFHISKHLNLLFYLIFQKRNFHF